MFESANRLTLLEELGEFALIGQISEAFPIKHADVLKGIGDDAAVIRKNDEESFLLSTDMLVEGVHFDLVYTPLKHLGYKAVASNVSDVAAMNAVPLAITVSLAVSSKYTLEAIEELFTGIRLACDAYKIDLIGGDTTSSRSGLVISVTVVGESKNHEIAYRSGARLSDLVVVSGDLGGAYTGLQILEREKQVFLADRTMQPELENFSYILEKQLKPEARIDVRGLLQKLDIKPTSMIDISDGLSSELHHLANQSGVGFTIYEDKIPVDQETYDTARLLNLDPTICALNGGEDYELLFTISVNDFEKIKGNPNFSVIGYCSEKENGINLITRNQETAVPITAQGWTGFSKTDH